MDKAPDAFRTISEVAEGLETPAHVLRFWESRFPQIKPVKRAGGRRYYRPADVALLAGIRQLLHTEGMTIRGVQKVLREQGVRHVASLGGADVDALDLDHQYTTSDLIATGTPAEDRAAQPEVKPAPVAPIRGQVLPLDHVARRPVDASSVIPAEVQALFAAPEPPPGAKSAPPTDPVPAPPVLAPSELPLTGPREGEGGLLAFPHSRRPKAKTPETDAAQASLPFEAPEAPHVWVEEEAEPAGALHRMPPAAARDRMAGVLAEELDSALSDAVARAVEAALSEPEDDTASGPQPPRPDPEVPAPDAPEFEPPEVELPDPDLPEFEVPEPESPGPLPEPELPDPEWPEDVLPVADFPDSDLPEPDMPDPDFSATAGSHLEEDAAGLLDPVWLGAEMVRQEPDLAPDGGPTTHPDDPPLPDFTGLAARLRALRGQAAPHLLDDLTELHSRLGLLHAQMAEAVRLRR